MRMSEQAIDESLKRYTMHRCYLVKKRRGLFRHVWVLECSDRKFRVNVGRLLYRRERVGAKLVVVRDGKKLINIKQGFSEI